MSVITSGQASLASSPTMQTLSRVWWLGPDLIVWHHVLDCAPLPI